MARRQARFRKKKFEAGAGGLRTTGGRPRKDRRPPSGPRLGAEPADGGLPSSKPIIEAVTAEPGLSTHQLAERFALGDDLWDAFVERLFALQRQGQIVRVPGEGWDLPQRSRFRAGVLHLDRKGAGFLQSAVPGEEDVYLRRDALRDAYGGDTVLVRITARETRERLREGQVVDVLERSRRLIRGSYQRGKAGAGFVVPDDRRRDLEIYVPLPASKGAIDGEDVLVRLTPGGHGLHPQGEVVVRLHGESSLLSDLEVIGAEFDLPGAHPAGALTEADSFPAIVPGQDWAGRTDLRGLLAFTIDPLAAQDFDDAVSLETLDHGRLRLGVHIADASHYVRNGSQLDASAEERGTSVYLPGKVIPMLPERLSGNLCSLRPQEDRLTKTVFLTFSPGGALEKVDLFPSVIHSRRRFTYEEVQAILDWTASKQGSASLPPDHAEYERILEGMARLRDRLRRARRRRGALYLDIPKLKVLFDGDSEPTGSGRASGAAPGAPAVTGIGREERDPAHELIEEFMLAANEAVASYFIEKELPLIARVHPPPEGDRLEEFESLLRVLGLKLRGEVSPRSFQRLIRELEGNPLSPVVQLALLRTMGHAEYRLGAGLHFALSTTAYCHFTSPIRRYPDLLVHQVLDEHWAGELGRASRRRDWESRLPQLAEWASYLERRAEDAERAMSQLCLVRFLEPMLGEELAGRITSVHPFGFFVRIEDILVEGLVHVATLGDDYYEFDKSKLCLLGRRGKRRFGLGDRVRVRLSALDPEAREISFQVASGGRKR